MSQSYYKAGDNNAICDTCGRTVKASSLQKTWDGFYVCPQHWEPRHPQDFVRAIREDPTVRINRPDTEPTFVAAAIALPLPGDEIVIEIPVPAFTPAELFAIGEQGLWYDYSDLTTMFQDRAGTTPVTADGQTVGKILDKSGRGNHAVAPSDAARPLYKTSGGLHWLKFDGVDDSLSTNDIVFTGYDLSVFKGISTALVADSTYDYLVGDSGNSGRADSYSYSDVNYFEVISNNQVAWTEFQFTPLTKYVYSVKMDINGVNASDIISFQVNGSAPAQTVSGSVGTNPFGTNKISIGSLNGLYVFNGNIYSLIIRGAASTTQEITDTETWVNGKTGAY